MTKVKFTMEVEFENQADLEQFIDDVSTSMRYDRTFRAQIDQNAAAESEEDMVEIPSRGQYIKQVTIADWKQHAAQGVAKRNMDQIKGDLDKKMELKD